MDVARLRPFLITCPSLPCPRWARDSRIPVYASSLATSTVHAMLHRSVVSHDGMHSQAMYGVRSFTSREYRRVRARDDGRRKTTACSIYVRHRRAEHHRRLISGTTSLCVVRNQEAARTYKGAGRTYARKHASCTCLQETYVRDGEIVMNKSLVELAVSLVWCDHQVTCSPHACMPRGSALEYFLLVLIKLLYLFGKRLYQLTSSNDLVNKNCIEV
jgi:hypothetical protein